MSAAHNHTSRVISHGSRRSRRCLNGKELPKETDAKPVRVPSGHHLKNRAGRSEIEPKRRKQVVKIDRRLIGKAGFLELGDDVLSNL